MIRRAFAAAAVVIVHAAIAAAGPNSFKPPSHVRAAQQHFERGTKLFDAHDFAGAAVEYAAAYQLDPDAKWLLYDIATAQRIANACPEAIDAYDQFIAAEPPAEEANLASEGKAACAQMLADAKRAADAQLEAARQARLAEEARRREDDAVQQHDRDVQIARERHDRELDARDHAEYAEQVVHVHRRVLGLGIAGAAAIVVAGGLYGLALYDASATHSATSRAAFTSSSNDAYHFQDAAWIAGGTGIALVATGAIYYWLGRPLPPMPHNSVAIVPAHAGALLVVGGPL